MGKKLTLLAMAVAAVAALVVPAGASAITLSDEETAHIPVGTEILGTNIGSVVTKNLPEGVEGGQLVCQVVNLPGEVTENSETKVAGSGEGGTTEECIQTNEFEEETEFLVGGISYELSSTEAEMGTGHVHLTFVVTFPQLGNFKCTYTGTGTFHYETGDDKLTITPTPLTGSPANPCENEEGTIEFEGKFTLETASNHKPVYITP